ncbi:hypothetical protein ACTXT7_016758, partial [Hymenolepis weldensis]
MEAAESQKRHLQYSYQQTRATATINPKPNIKNNHSSSPSTYKIPQFAVGGDEIDQNWSLKK